LFGPWKYEFGSSAKRKPLYGTYFSVWTKNKNGLWKVFFDGGINTPVREFELNNLTFTSLSDSMDLKKRKMYKPAVSKKEILRLEKNFFLKSGINNIPAAETYFSDKSYLITEGEFPLIGKKEILNFLNKAGKKKYSGDFKGIRVAESGDMAFTYGKYKSAGDKSITNEFYFGRIWKKTPAGEWEIVVQVQKPVE
jgi:ketosteroid isomerase-like protein